MRNRGLRRRSELGLGTPSLAPLALALSVSFVGGAGCGSSRGAAAPANALAGSTGTPEAGATPPLVPGANPFAGIAIYRTPYSNAENAQHRLEKTNPAEAALVAKIADQPQASWFGNWSGDIKTSAGNYVNAAERAGQLALLVAYNIPDRDCGQYSAGGAKDSGSYVEWIKGLAAGIGARRAVVVLEPDALGLLTQCLTPPDQEKRLELIRQAVVALKAQPGTSVYIDAGHSNWVPAPEMAERLKKAGVADARGFALNTSNFQKDEELLVFGKSVVAALGTDVHFVIDSSRNGNGPAPLGNEEWCNPEGRALGRAPTIDTGEPTLDAFLWLKRPGESDGECKGGPAAGQWFEARALEMARSAKW